MHEAVANHFSLAINDEGTRFLMNPNQVHFARVKASDLIVVDANDPDTLSGPNAPDATAWGAAWGACTATVSTPGALCMYIQFTQQCWPHSPTAVCRRLIRTPRRSSTVMWVDDHYGGLAFEQEGKRCAQLLTDPRKKVLIMGNHGVMIIGDTVADTFDRLFYFERAAETYIRALQTGQPLRVLSDEVAEKAARELEEYPGQGARHLDELKAILDDEGSNYSQ